MTNSHVPKFGNWDSAENVPYSAYFESARKAATATINPNDKEVFNSIGGVENNNDGDVVKVSSGIYSNNKSSSSQKIIKHEEGGSNARHLHHRRSRRSHGSFTSTAESGTERVKSDHKKSLSVGASIISSSSHVKRRSGRHSLNDHAKHEATQVPQFGAWDVKDPKSGEGYTALFKKIKEEKQIASTHINIKTKSLNQNQGGTSSPTLLSKIEEEATLPPSLPHSNANANAMKRVRVSDWIQSCSNELLLNIYHHWFSFADSDGDGRITGNDAINFFALSNLSRPQLKQVWAIADTRRQGFLGFSEFVTAMQLVSLAQAGFDINPDFLKTEIDEDNINPPVMEGLDALVAKTKPVTPSDQLEVDGAAQSQPLAPNPRVASKSVKKLPLNAVTSIIDGLKRLYVERLMPLEVTYQFNDFVSPLLTDSDFDAKPMVILLGQYSTGKTTFIKHLLKCDYPGAHIGPEPTTDRFVAVMSGPDERSIPGNTVAVDASMPFSGLSTFGGSFLSKFQCSQMPHPLLDEITFVDTPGVLSGEKQRTQRSYDFTGVITWFAAKCDLILLLFDPHKLDISDEFKRVIASIRGHDDKIRVVLNKADQIDAQQLMRVYGALMWSLGKVLNTPEVVRVYIGSFNDKPINEGFLGPLGQELFEKEQNDLLIDLVDMPRKACDSRINEFVKRARAAKIHAYIISHLKKQMPIILGKAKAQQQLIDNLEDEFRKVQREFHLPAGDFPNVEHFREILSGYSIDRFEKLKPKMIQAVDDMLAYDIPELLKKFRNPYG
ncbi:hypothetical protein RIF29_08224 [Crotalaria pallida]|uniref:EH domain-containing protein 1 n=1 Tax=Crotalaria pallida TaxID=3830 RepID=A0AAN9PBA1_CROPI